MIQIVPGSVWEQINFLHCFSRQRYISSLQKWSKLTRKSSSVWKATVFDKHGILSPREILKNKVPKIEGSLEMKSLFTYKSSYSNYYNKKVFLMHLSCIHLLFPLENLVWNFFILCNSLYSNYFVKTQL